MKYIKMLGLLAVAAAALMAFAGTAAASTLTSPPGTKMAVGATIKATSTNTKLHGSFITVECGHSNVEGKITQNGTTNGSTTNAGGEVTLLTFTNCNYEVTYEKAKKGTLEISKTGEVVSNGAEVAIHTSVGECVFTTANTKIGTLTGSDVTKGHAVLDIGSAGIKRSSGSFFCGSEGIWTGNYTVTSPTYLAVH